MRHKLQLFLMHAFIAVMITALCLAGYAAGEASALSLSNSGGGSWQYSREMSIKADSALTDYQTLVKLSSSTFPANARSYGADIRRWENG